MFDKALHQRAFIKFSYRQHPWLAFLLLLISFSLHANIQFNANEVDSINHFRAIPIYLENDKKQAFVRHSIQDARGFIWTSDTGSVTRYDGYKETLFPLPVAEEIDSTLHPYLFINKDRVLWAASTNLHRFDPSTDSFTHFKLDNKDTINTVVEDSKGYLWLIGRTFTVIKFDPSTGNSTYLSSADILSRSKLPFTYLTGVDNAVYDETLDLIWLVSDQGIYTFDITSQSLSKVFTEIDPLLVKVFVRDITLDTARNELWIGSPVGLLRIDTITGNSVMYKGGDKAGDLPISDVSTTFIDSSGNIWLGLEKEGFCTFKHINESFLCMRSSSFEKHALPVATVEDISEDAEGSLWLSMNGYGLYRVTPDIEKFTDFFNTITAGHEHYFPNTFGGLVRDNSQIWLATDGGGINVFDINSGVLSAIKHDSNNSNSLSSNSVISITEDENGDIWAGTWAGGISRIDPTNNIITRYETEPQKINNVYVSGANIFVVKADQKGGIWASVWEGGLQYLEVNTGAFTNYFFDASNQNGAINNKNITHFQLYDNQIWIAGLAGLEVFDTETKKFTMVLSNTKRGYTYVWVESLEEIWIGSQKGLILLNSVSGETTTYDVDDGLADNKISYIKKDEFGRIWVGTGNGLSVLHEDRLRFTNYLLQDGMVGNQMSAHGEFLEVGALTYVPSKSGLTIVDAKALPTNNYRPRTFINSVNTLNSSQKSENRLISEALILPISANSIQFEFSALSFIFPEKNRYKYRLAGWQTDYVYTNANSRSVSYTNLPAGNYTFEVFGSNNKGIWDEAGDSFSFTILPAWWDTWWAKLIFIVAFALIAYSLYKWRFAVTIQREKELQNKVKDKTAQLNSYAAKLQESSQSLAKLNSELEQRVEQRTAELNIEMTERKAVEKKLLHMAFHDSLTELPNREWIIQNIEKLIARCQAEPEFSFGVMFLDGDRFKQINDTLGHVAGDQLLIESSLRLLSLMNETQYIGRLGGDEFTVIVESPKNGHLTELAQKIIDEFSRPFEVKNNSIYFNVSVGIVHCDAEYKTAPEVLRNADISMYRAKELGRGRYQVFDTHMQRSMLEIAELEAGLRTAIDKQEFFLEYQPIIDLDDGLVSGFEALIRWRHPEMGIVSPFKFIPIAEETGFIWEIGKWVLHEACRQTKQWHDAGFEIKPSIAVNLSTNQIRNSRFLAMLDEAISDTGVPPEYLKLELTESMIIENNEDMAALYDAFESRNIELAIDDFGTGYSSLSYLNEIPVDYLKIDRSFVKAIDQNMDGAINTNALKIVKGTISLGKSLNKKIIAEGIETPTQLRRLISLGCDFAQGYFMSRPIAKDKATALLGNNKSMKHGGANIPKDDYQLEYTVREQKR